MLLHTRESSVGLWTGVDTTRDRAHQPPGLAPDRLPGAAEQGDRRPQRVRARGRHPPGRRAQGAHDLRDHGRHHDRPRDELDRAGQALRPPRAAQGARGARLRGRGRRAQHRVQALQGDRGQEEEGRPRSTSRRSSPTRCASRPPPTSSSGSTSRPAPTRAPFAKVARADARRRASPRAASPATARWTRFFSAINAATGLEARLKEYHVSAVTAGATRSARSPCCSSSTAASRSGQGVSHGHPRGVGPGLPAGALERAGRTRRSRRPSTIAGAPSAARSRPLSRRASPSGRRAADPLRRGRARRGAAAARRARLRRLRAAHDRARAGTGARASPTAPPRCSTCRRARCPTRPRPCASRRGERPLVALGGGRVIDAAKAIARRRRRRGGGASRRRSPGAADHALPPHARGRRGRTLVRPVACVCEPGRWSQRCAALAASAMNALAHAMESLYAPTRTRSPRGRAAGAELFESGLRARPRRATTCAGPRSSPATRSAAPASRCTTPSARRPCACGTPHAQTNAVMLPHSGGL